MQIITRSGYLYTLNCGLIIFIIMALIVISLSLTSPRDDRVCGAAAIPKQKHYLLFTYMTKEKALEDHAYIMYPGPCHELMVGGNESAALEVVRSILPDLQPKQHEAVAAKIEKEIAKIKKSQHKPKQKDKP